MLVLKFAQYIVILSLVRKLNVMILSKNPKCSSDVKYVNLMYYYYIKVLVKLIQNVARNEMINFLTNLSGMVLYAAKVMKTMVKSCNLLPVQFVAHRGLNEKHNISVM